MILNKTSNAITDLMTMENLPSIPKDKKVVYFEMPYKKPLEKTMLVSGITMKDITLPIGSQTQGKLEAPANETNGAKARSVRNGSTVNISLVPAATMELKGVSSPHTTITVLNSTPATDDKNKSIRHNIQKFHVQKASSAIDNVTNGKDNNGSNGIVRQYSPIQLNNPSICITADISDSLELEKDVACKTIQQKDAIHCSTKSISDTSTSKFEISAEEGSPNNVDEICLQVNCDDNSFSDPSQRNSTMELHPNTNSSISSTNDTITHVTQAQIERENSLKTCLVGEEKMNGEKVFIRTGPVVVRRRVSKDQNVTQDVEPKTCDNINKLVKTVHNGNSPNQKDVKFLITSDAFSRVISTNKSKSVSAPTPSKELCPTAKVNVRLVKKCSSVKRQLHSNNDEPANCKRKKTTGDIFGCRYCGNFGILVESLKSNGSDFCSDDCLKAYNEEKISSEKDISDDEKCIKLSETSDRIPAVPFPWGDDDKTFCWNLYLKHVTRLSPNMIGAPTDLWDVPYPPKQCPLRPEAKLEVIDPFHQSMFCVATVSHVIGSRVRIHFDGYSPLYDFWCNSDSPLLFPMDWCSKHKRKLCSPPGLINFSWDAYLDHCGQKRPAIVSSFGTSDARNDTRFEIGMKLEAEDRKNCLICVATVIDVIGSRILVTFDGWEKVYDSWFDVTSSFIHPIGWAQKNDVDLCVPKDYKKPAYFNWTEYLMKTRSRAAPHAAFAVRPPKAFRIGMKIEAVDKRNPTLLRVATVVAIDGYKIKIHFDGWDDIYDYWIDDDCPDVHPPNWGQQSGHPLQPPLTQEQCAVDVDSGIGCGTPGCKGFGHFKGLVYENHHTIHGCPYSLLNLNIDWRNNPVDRLVSVPVTKTSTRNAVNLARTVSPAGDDDIHGKRVRKRRRFFDEISEAPPSKTTKMDENCRKSPVAQSPKPVTIKTPSPPQEKLPTPAVRSQKREIISECHQTVFRPKHSINVSEKLSQKLPDLGLGKLCYKNIAQLKPSDIKVLVEKIGCQSHWSEKFVAQEIDGIAFVMLEQSDLTDVLKIALGPSKRIMLCVEHIKLACTT